MFLLCTKMCRPQQLQMIVAILHTRTLVCMPLTIRCLCKWRFFPLAKYENSAPASLAECTNIRLSTCMCKIMHNRLFQRECFECRQRKVCFMMENTMHFVVHTTRQNVYTSAVIFLRDCPLYVHGRAPKEWCGGLHGSGLTLPWQRIEGDLHFIAQLTTAICTIVVHVHLKHHIHFHFPPPPWDVSPSEAFLTTNYTHVSPCVCMNTLKMVYGWSKNAAHAGNATYLQFCDCFQFGRWLVEALFEHATAIREIQHCVSHFGCSYCIDSSAQILLPQYPNEKAQKVEPPSWCSSVKGRSSISSINTNLYAVGKLSRLATCEGSHSTCVMFAVFGHALCSMKLGHYTDALVCRSTPAIVDVTGVFSSEKKKDDETLVFVSTATWTRAKDGAFFEKLECIKTRDFVSFGSCV